MDSAFCAPVNGRCANAESILPNRCKHLEIHIMSDCTPTDDSEDDERELVIDEVIKHLLENELGKVERAEARVERTKRRNLRRRRQRAVMYENPHLPNQKIAKLLRGHPERLRRQTRLTLYQFERLAAWLKDNTDLKGSRYVNLNAKLGIFLYICGSGCTFRNAAEYFEVSNSQVSIFFHQVLNALVKLAKHNIKMYEPDEDIPVPPQIAEHPGKMSPYFDDCIGAVDGTLMYCSVKGKDRDRDGEDGAFRCRKGFLAQNVLGVVDFDMNFRLVYGGWEGTAHDATIFNAARQEGLMNSPAGRIWLADAGYSKKDGYGGLLLAPYIRTRYHLQEWRRGNQRPQNKEELFNLRHAKLRNVVERVYGVFKARFQIFRAARDGFSIKTQTKLVYATSAVHNWINSHGGRPKKEWRKLKNAKKGSKAAQLYEEMLIERAVAQENSAPLEEFRTDMPTAALGRLMHAKRDRIASQMWEHYQLILADRNRREEPPDWESSNSELSDSSGIDDMDGSDVDKE